MSNLDQITLQRIQLLHPSVRAEASNIYRDISAALTGRAMCRFTHTLRTFAEQNELFAQGRTKPGKIVTNARAGRSFHNYGLAVDIALIINGTQASWDTISDFDGDRVADWMECVNVFKRYGWEWGGDWKGTLVDAPHFQRTFGYTTAQLRNRLTAGSTYPNI